MDKERYRLYGADLFMLLPSEKGQCSCYLKIAVVLDSEINSCCREKLIIEYTYYFCFELESLLDN
ncbi:hypothetical protein AHMF7616_02345 [Adhaeribacter pallidiroseus]|uniref:Uncharacterized protein n=1 Tax=Adhaeribacter pallidiroseus TaxID=2072847 RepID=A0A369QKG0_9BACT|nr:hypothetical protein AHMF7616_02345 [Adhaeribacter pallidiroseus]